jgi:hypothetical protein
VIEDRRRAIEDAGGPIEDHGHPIEEIEEGGGIRHPSRIRTPKGEILALIWRTRSGIADPFNWQEVRSIPTTVHVRAEVRASVVPWSQRNRLERSTSASRSLHIGAGGDLTFSKDLSFHILPEIGVNMNDKFRSDTRIMRCIPD